MAVGACTVGPADAVIETFDQSRVALRAEYRAGAAGGDGVVVATLTPTDPTLHLYGIDLPVDGIDGAGRPSRIELRDADWEPAGELTASAEPSLLSLPGFDEPFPVYPEGPVTLELPVRQLGTGGDGTLTVAVTFMACSDRVCFAPVIDHEVTLRAG